MTKKKSFICESPRGTEMRKELIYVKGVARAFNRTEVFETPDVIADPIMNSNAHKRLSHDSGFDQFLMHSSVQQHSHRNF